MKLMHVRSFALKHPRDLKMTIKIVPRSFPEGGGGEIQNHEIEDRMLPPEKIGGGETPLESTFGGLHPPPTCSSSTSTARSSHLSTVNSWQT